MRARARPRAARRRRRAGRARRRDRASPRDGRGAEQAAAEARALLVGPVDERHACTGGVPAAADRRAAPRARAITPSAPSSQPPFGTESTCEPTTTVSGRSPASARPEVAGLVDVDRRPAARRGARAGTRARSTHSSRPAQAPRAVRAAGQLGERAQVGDRALTARQAISTSSSPRAKLRDDLLAVGSKRLLWVLGHEVDVPLRDADRLELAQLRDVILDRAEDAEAIAGLVVDELAVLRRPCGCARSSRRTRAARGSRVRRSRQQRLVVALSRSNDVVRDHRREPARPARAPRRGRRRSRTGAHTIASSAAGSRPASSAAARAWPMIHSMMSRSASWIDRRRRACRPATASAFGP